MTSINTPPHGSSSSVRNYGIDLLRMLSMYMVCVLHVIGQGGIFDGTRNMPGKYCIAWLLEISAYCAVNCFALISGYVGVTAKFRYRNLVRLWLQVLFWSCVLALGCKFFYPEAVSGKDLLKSLFPASTGAYWYFSSYVLMFFTIPLMNFLLLNAEKSLLKTFFFTCFVLYSLLGCLPGLEGLGAQLKAGYSAIWLAMLYMVGGFVRLHCIEELFSIAPNARNYLVNCYNGVISWLFATPARRLLIYAACVGITFIIRTGGHFVVTKLIGSDPICCRIVSYLSPTIVLCSLLLLDFFAKLAVGQRLARIIQMASPIAFGVYLIQNQRQIWKLVFRGAFEYVGVKSPIWLLPFAILASAAGIYVVCSMLDWLRLKLFKLLKLT